MIPEPITLAVTKGAVSALMKPAIEKTLAVLGKIPDALMNLFTDKFGSYMETQYERHAYLNTLVLGEQKNLDELYIPLTVIPSTNGAESHEKGIRLDGFRKEFLQTHNRVLVTDTAGMGKSTLMKFLFLECIKTKYAIPIFIELRHLSQSKNVIDLIEQQLNLGAIATDRSYFGQDKIREIIKEGGLVFFLDGYDEIPFKDREKVTIDLKEFIDIYPNNTFAITSRPETGLSAFPSFKQYTIRPLQKDESFELIKKYDKHGARSQQLIERLKGREFKSVMEFLKNPLLTTLLYRCYEYKQSLPLKKHVFYRQVFDALFDWHDATKDGYNTREKKSKLDIDSFHRVLRVMGIISVMKGEVEGTTDTVLSWIREARKICVGLSFAESDFLDDVVRAVPVFIKDGTSYRWSHKSLAEYFAAQYVCTEGKQMQDKIFNSMWDSKKLYRFSNMLDQIYDLDILAFRKYFILPMAREFSTYWANSYKSFSGSMAIEDINLRKSVCFGAQYIISSKIDHNVLRDFRNHVASSMSASVEQMTMDEVPFTVSIRYDNKEKEAQPIFIFVFQKPFLVILQILEAKKDILVQSKAKFDWSGNKAYPTKKAIKKPAEVTDDINNELNSKRNFNAVTKLLVTNPFGIVIDHEKMLNFETGLQDEVAVSNFADNLLSSISQS